MAWTTPPVFTVGEVATSSNMNILGSDLSFLYGDVTWTPITAFTNSWTAGAVAPAYIALGRTACLRGIVTGGAANQVAFTLPTGYRPSAQYNYATLANGAFAAGIVATTGAVTPSVGSTTSFWLDIVFPTV